MFTADFVARQEMTTLSATNETRVGFNSEGTSASASFAVSTIVALIFLVSTTGNSLVIAVVVKSINMKTTMNLLVVNMAASDLVTNLLCIPLQMGTAIVGRWPFSLGSTAGLVICKVSLTTAIISTNVSVGSLVAIALDRFLAVFFPTRQPLSTRRPLLTLAVIWILCITLAFPYFLVTKVLGKGDRVFCLPDEATGFSMNLDMWLLSILQVGLPIIVILVLYPAILIRLWKRKFPGNPSTANQEIRDRANRKVTYMAVTLMIAFVVSWFPCFGVLMKDFIERDKLAKKRDSLFYLISLLLAYSSCAWNPLICIGFNSSFRKGFKELFRKYISCCCVIGNSCFRRNHIGNVSAHVIKPAVELCAARVIKIANL